MKVSTNQKEQKLKGFNFENSPPKASITNHYFFNESLGLPLNTEQDAVRKELAAEVLQFMWSLCLDEAVFGIIE
jgi:hypothetical protein